MLFAASGAAAATPERPTISLARRGLSLVAALALSACATARLHTNEELSAVGRTCGAAEGEVVQDAEEPRILFFYAAGAPRAEVHCLALWARRHHLHLAYIQAVEQQGQ